jgi:hypothetical protein
MSIPAMGLRGERERKRERDKKERGNKGVEGYLLFLRRVGGHMRGILRCGCDLPLFHHAAAAPLVPLSLSHLSLLLSLFLSAALGFLLLPYRWK